MIGISPDKPRAASYCLQKKRASRVSAAIPHRLCHLSAYNTSPEPRAAWARADALSSACSLLVTAQGCAAGEFQFGMAHPARTCVSAPDALGTCASTAHLEAHWRPATSSCTATPLTSWPTSASSGPILGCERLCDFPRSPTEGDWGEGYTDYRAPQLSHGWGRRGAGHAVMGDNPAGFRTVVKGF